MTIIDILIIIIFIAFIFNDYRKGVADILFSLAGIVASIYVGAVFYKTVGNWLLPLIKNEALSYIIAFVAILILVNILFRTVGSKISDFMENWHLGWVNKLLGAVVGFVKAFLIVSSILFILAAAIPEPNTIITELKKSRVVLGVMELAKVVIGFFPHDTLIKVQEWLQKAWEELKPS